MNSSHDELQCSQEIQDRDYILDSKLAITYASVTACSSVLSIMGSSTIIYIVWRGGKKKWSRVQNRLLFAMSVVDIFYSSALGLSYIPNPTSKCSFGYGTVLTCNIQGFFIQMGMALPLYVTMLSLYAFMSIAYNVSENIIAQKYEPIMHAVCILPTFVMATIGAIGHVFFNENGVCWILYSSWFDDNCQGNCYSWSKVVGNILFWASMVIMSTSQLLMYYCLFRIYRTIRTRAIRMRRFAFEPSVIQRNQRCQRPSVLERSVNEAAKQSLLYVLGHGMTYIWTLLYLAVPTENQTFQSFIYILTGIFLPLHGFWNFLAYIRPRFLALRRENEGLSFLQTLQQIVFDNEEKEGTGPKKETRMRRRASFPLASTDELPLDIGGIDANSLGPKNGSSEFSDDYLTEETCYSIEVAAAAFRQSIRST